MSLATWQNIWHPLDSQSRVVCHPLPEVQEKTISQNDPSQMSQIFGANSAKHD